MNFHQKTLFLQFLITLCQLLLASSSSSRELQVEEKYNNTHHFGNVSTKYSRRSNLWQIKFRAGEQKRYTKRQNSQTLSLIFGNVKSVTLRSSRNFSSKKDVNRREISAWDESCSRDKNYNRNISRNSMISLWKDDLFTLQACDIIRPNNETSNNTSTITTPQPAIIISAKYLFRRKDHPIKKPRYCDPPTGGGSSSREIGVPREVASICSPKGNAFDGTLFTLPFCSHLTISDVLQANPDLAKQCGVFEKTYSLPPRDSCQTCSNELLRLDKLARLGYCALEGILDRADCKIPYSPTTASCETCKNVYRIWLCAQFFERLRFPSNASDYQTNENQNSDKSGGPGYIYRYPCPTLCYNVMKMCPYTNPIWDVASAHPGVVTLEPVEYSGWPSFHCPTTLPQYINDDESCYDFSKAETGEPKFEIGYFKPSGSSPAMEICFHVLVLSVLLSSTYAL